MHGSTRFRSVTGALGVALLVFSAPGFAQSGAESSAVSPVTIDDLGFGAAMDDRLFTSSYQVNSVTTLAPVRAGSGAARGLDISTTLEFNARRASGIGLDTRGFDFDSRTNPAADDTSVRRFSTALKGSTGTLTVGHDWSNFQDFLQRDSAPASIASQGLTSEQVSWASAGQLGEFSVAFERDYSFLGPRTAADGLGLANAGDDGSVDGAPSLILSWRGSTADQRGQYSFSALGREFDTESGEDLEDEGGTGWGINLAGGWRFGELFAALSVTLGNSIDSFILGRVGDRKTAAEASRFLSPSESISINPSLNYRLGEHSNVHLAFNRFASDSADVAHGVETLDTIHLGYTWTPWPSTRIGIEIVGKDVEGPGTMEDSNEVNFAASKRF